MLDMGSPAKGDMSRSEGEAVDDAASDAAEGKDELAAQVLVASAAEALADAAARLTKLRSDFDAVAGAKGAVGAPNREKRALLDQPAADAFIRLRDSSGAVVSASAPEPERPWRVERAAARAHASA